MTPTWSLLRMGITLTSTVSTDSTSLKTSGTVSAGELSSACTNRGNSVSASFDDLNLLNKVRSSLQRVL